MSTQGGALTPRTKRPDRLSTVKVQLRQEACKTPCVLRSLSAYLTRLSTRHGVSSRCSRARPAGRSHEGQPATLSVHKGRNRRTVRFSQLRTRPARS